MVYTWIFCLEGASIWLKPDLLNFNPLAKANGNEELKIWIKKIIAVPFMGRINEDTSGFSQNLND